MLKLYTKKWGQGNLCVCLTSYLYRNFAFLSGKPLNDPITDVKNVSDKFFLHGEHSKSIQAIRGVPQEGLDPL